MTHSLIKIVIRLKRLSENSYFFMEATPHGGHVGFNSTFNVNLNDWHENRIVGFLTKQE